MTIKLSLLDRLTSFRYSPEMNVIVESKILEPIGVCRLFRNEEGSHLGELELIEKVNLDLYFYYLSEANYEGAIHIVALNLVKEPSIYAPTVQLKDILV